MSPLGEWWGHALALQRRVGMCAPGGVVAITMLAIETLALRARSILTLVSLPPCAA